jgi:Tol biopolymer transport system component
MLTGALPFQGATHGVVFDAILNKRPAPLPATAPAELSHILDKALEKDRELRYQSARELRADVARLKRDSSSIMSGVSIPAVTAAPPAPKRRTLIVAIAALAVVIAAVAGYFAWSQRDSAAPASPTLSTTLTRLTFDEGLQAQPVWSPDGRFVAYSSNQSGNFDIWVQPVGGGRAVQVTTDAAVDWQPSWSPDGNTLAFRSERAGGGVFLVPALGGRERQLASFGHLPQWSPDGKKVLVARDAPLTGASEVIPHVFLLDPGGAQPARILEEALASFDSVRRMVWHPDGRRVSFMAEKDGAIRFWTVPIAGGAAVPAERSDEVNQRITEQLQFILIARWAPAGNAVYLEGLSQRVTNVWRVDVDPGTLRWVSGPTRLTTGPGIDGDVSISADGTKLAFVTRTETSRLWSLPLDARTRQVTGEGAAVTPANMTVSGFDLGPDGQLVYIAGRPGKTTLELWSKPIALGDPLMITEAFVLFGPRLSRDGRHVGYRVRETQAVRRRVKWRPLAGGAEQALMEGTSTIWDWSPDGTQMIIYCPPTHASGSLCTARPTDTTDDAARPLVVDAEYNIWQGRYSPDGKWVLFNAQSRKEPGVSILGVVPAGGGRWTPLTDKTLWADKARWGHDGRTIYFISNRESAFFDVWAVGFDPVKGAITGDESRVTRYDNPGRLISASGLSELGVNATQLVVPITETSGSVWILDGVDRKR